MQYFIKRAGKVQKPISHQQLMAFAKQKKLKKSDLIAVSKDGPFQKLATVWDSIKNSKPVAEVEIPLAVVSNNEESITLDGRIVEKTSPTLDKSRSVVVIADQITPSLKLAVSSVVLGILAFLLAFKVWYIGMALSAAGIVCGIISVRVFKYYDTSCYVGVGLSCLAFLCSASEHDSKVQEAKRSIYESNKPRIKAAKEAEEVASPSEPKPEPSIFDQFIKVDVVDKFGDSTGSRVKKFVDRNGTFSNSATANTKLVTSITLWNEGDRKKEDVTFEFYEYGRDVEAAFLYEDGWTLAIRTDTGENITFYLRAKKNSLYKNPSQKLLKVARQSKKIRCVVSNPKTPTVYRFSFPCKGL